MSNKGFAKLTSFLISKREHLKIFNLFLLQLKVYRWVKKIEQNSNFFLVKFFYPNVVQIQLESSNTNYNSFTKNDSSKNLSQNVMKTENMWLLTATKHIDENK